MMYLERLYAWSCRFLTALSGAATAFALWVLYAATFTPALLGEARAQNAIALGVVAVALIAPALLVAIGASRWVMAARAGRAAPAHTAAAAEELDALIAAQPLTPGAKILRFPRAPRPVYVEGDRAGL